MPKNNRINDTNQTKGNFGDAFTYDPKFNGPTDKRSCTDIFFLIIFIAFISGWIVIAFIGYSNGNPEKLIYPTDSYGDICGRGQYHDRPYLFFFNLLKCAKNLNHKIFDRCDTPQVCVSQCPTQTFSLYQLNRLDERYKSLIICKYNITATNENFKQLINDDKCAGIYFKSEPFAGRCIPSLLTMSGQILTDEMTSGGNLMDNTNTAIDLKKIKDTNQAIVLLLNAQQVGYKIIQDLRQTFSWIIIGFGLAMLISFLWIVCMQWFAHLMIWFSILAVIVLNSCGLYYAVNRYTTLSSETTAEPLVNVSSKKSVNYDFRKSMDNNLDSYLANRDTWFAFSIICAIVLFILILVLLFLRKRIKLAIALIVEASRAVSCVKSSLFFPVIPYLMQLIVISYWATVAILIASSARPQYKNLKTGQDCHPNLILDSDPQSCVFIQYFESNVIFAAHLYNLFGLLWGLFFVIGVGQVSLAGAFASYYWVFKKPQGVPFFAVFGGLYRCFRYHTGSVALGSLLIATIRFIRIIIEYINEKCKKYADNCFVKVVMCCCRCWFWLLEIFMKYINKNAYIMIAVYGNGFCTSAKDGFLLILRNATRATVLDKVTDLLLIIGKLTVTSSMAILSFYAFSHKLEFLDIPTLNYYWVPIVVITFGTYLIASSFFSVYSMAVDTLFLCFLEDCERNDGSHEKPYYMSKNLMKVLGKKKK
ncbi:choline transporter-like protein 5 [Oppia nitens]|uniref:choline transporter-like protein 5 n=1 Tax=Oppia nitens TaxID=1686743 RepID=UPI0023DA8241|nr:choline transporter-like protein 5 [Oppia nitens]